MITGHLSKDMHRIINLPVKPPNEWGGWPVFASLYKDYDNSPMQLNKLQRIALSTLKTQRGLLGLLPVGWGKTLIGLLAPSVVEARRPIYLTRSKNVETVYEEWRKFRQHFHIAENLKVYGYEGQLSRADFATLLDDYKPDCVVVDEAHCLAQRTAARTKRFIRYFQACEAAGTNPVCVTMSGTLTKRSIKDYEHLSRIALREGSPLPIDEAELQAWSTVLDAGTDAMFGDYTQLRALGEFASNQGQIGNVPGCAGPVSSDGLQSHYRDAFRQRLSSSPGVVTTREPSVECSIYLNLWETVQTPQEIDGLISDLEADPVAFGLLPPTDVMSPQAYADYINTFVAEKSNQMLHGFYYTLDWPGGVVDMDYINARSVWGKLLAIELGVASAAGYDSPALVVQAIESGKCSNGDLADAWNVWKQEKRKPEPPQKIVWVSNYMIQNVALWLHQSGPGSIAWCAYDAFGQRFKADTPFEYYGAGDSKPTAPQALASQNAHRTGHNLQHYQKGLVISPILSGEAWEQLLGRWHRQGQEADEVSCEILLHTDRYKRKWQAALTEARYMEDTTGQKQKILYAEKHKQKGAWLSV